MSQVAFRLPNHHKYSETQQELLDMLSDGRPHGKAEVKKVLCDPEAKDPVPGAHIRALRNAMTTNDPGYTVITQIGIYRKISYILVRLVNTDSE